MSVEIHSNDAYFPYSVALEVTLACNMRCLHCGSYASGADRLHSLSFSEWCKVVDQLKTLQTTYITLSGGEPFLYPQWRELCQYIVNQGMDVMLISNGSRIREEDVLFMKENRVRQLAISLDGNENVHDFLRQYKGAYKNVIDVMRYCQKHKLRLGIVTSFNQHNFSIRQEILHTMAENKIKLWQVQIVNSFGRANEHKEKMILRPEQYLELVKDIKAWRSQYQGQMIVAPADSIGYCHPDIDSLMDDTQWQGCNAGKYVLGIEANGNVKGCLSLQDDRFIAGNVRTRSLVDIWNDDEAFFYTRKYSVDKMEGACKDCASAEQCRAGCLGMAYSIHNSIYENSYCYRAILKKQIPNT